MVNLLNHVGRQANLGIHQCLQALGGERFEEQFQDHAQMGEVEQEESEKQEQYASHLVNLLPSCRHYNHSIPISICVMAMTILLDATMV